jgi:hypothetical protein
LVQLYCKVETVGTCKMNAFIKEDHSCRKKEKKVNSDSIPQSFLNERLFCFFRSCVEYKRSLANHDIVLIDRCPVSSKKMATKPGSNFFGGDVFN